MLNSGSGHGHDCVQLTGGACFIDGQLIQQSHQATLSGRHPITIVIVVMLTGQRAGHADHAGIMAWQALP